MHPRQRIFIKDFGTAKTLFRVGAVVPELIHFVRRGRLQRADEAEAEELRVGKIPDALGQLRVLQQKT